jgi:hypothetical protein
MRLNLREIPALYEMSGYIAGRLAEYSSCNVVPRHPRCDGSINHIWKQSNRQATVKLYTRKVSIACKLQTCKWTWKNISRQTTPLFYG